jgi:S-adenosylmethionine decarboxylase
MIGTHIIIDAYEISSEKFKFIHSDYDNFNAEISKLIEQHKMTIVSYQFKEFNDSETIGAFTSLYLLSESHVSFHTWPEKNYIAIDIFTCGECNTKELASDILKYLKCSNYDLKTLNRGNNIK